MAEHQERRSGITENGMIVFENLPRQDVFALIGPSGIKRTHPRPAGAREKGGIESSVQWLILGIISLRASADEGKVWITPEDNTDSAEVIADMQKWFAALDAARAASEKRLLERVPTGRHILGARAVEDTILTHPSLIT